MTVHNSKIEFETKGAFDIVDLTEHVREVVRLSDVYNGDALPYAGHATGIIILNEHDYTLLEDLKGFMKALTPENEDHHHPVNVTSHLRSMLFTLSQVVPVHDGHLALGTW